MKVNEDDTEEEEREKRQIDFNMDKLEAEQKPEELKAVFQGATTEKIKGNFSQYKLKPSLIMSFCQFVNLFFYFLQ